jgi:hypothetical protein
MESYTFTIAGTKLCVSLTSLARGLKGNKRIHNCSQVERRQGQFHTTARHYYACQNNCKYALV